MGLAGAECPPRISQPLLEYLAAKSGTEEMTVASLQGETQKTVSLKVDLHNLQLLTDRVSELGSVRDTARLASLGLPHAGDWLNVVPSPALGAASQTCRVHSLSEVQAGM